MTIFILSVLCSILSMTTSHTTSLYLSLLAFILLVVYGVRKHIEERKDRTK